jgi:hypothetical protein
MPKSVRETRAADFDGVQREGIGDHLLQVGRVAVEIAIERVGAAGAALIDEYNVAAGAEQAVSCIAGCGFGGRLSRSAGQDEQWVGCALLAERGKDYDVQPDLTAGFGGAVFPDWVGGALNLRGDTRHATGVRFRFDGGDWRAGGASQGAEQEQCKKKPHAV